MRFLNRRLFHSFVRAWIICEKIIAAREGQSSFVLHSVAPSALNVFKPFPALTHEAIKCRRFAGRQACEATSCA